MNIFEQIARRHKIFMKWCESKRITKPAPVYIVRAYNEISSYCMDKRISKVELWLLEDSSSFNKIRISLSGNRLFRLQQTENAKMLDKTWRMFMEFLDYANNQSSKNSETQDPPSVTKAIVPEVKMQPDWIRFDGTNYEQFERTFPVYCIVNGNKIEGKNWASIVVEIVERELEAQNPLCQKLYTESLVSNRSSRPFFFARKIDGQNCANLSNGYWINLNYSIPRLIKLIEIICKYFKYDESKTMFYGVSKEAATPEIEHEDPDQKTELSEGIVLSFNGMQDFRYTKPLWFSYKGMPKTFADTWSGVYIQLMRFMVNDYPHVFVAGLSLLNGDCIDIAYSNECSKLRRFAPLTDHLVIETNISAKGIVKRIALAAAMVKLTERDIEIHFVESSGEHQETPSENSPCEPKADSEPTVSDTVVTGKNEYCRTPGDDELSKKYPNLYIKIVSFLQENYPDCFTANEIDRMLERPCRMSTLQTILSESSCVENVTWRYRYIPCEQKSDINNPSDFYYWMRLQEYNVSDIVMHEANIKFISNCLADAKWENCVDWYSENYSEVVEFIGNILEERSITRLIVKREHCIETLQVFLKYLQDMVENGKSALVEYIFSLKHPFIFQRLHYVSQIYQDPQGFSIDAICSMINYDGERQTIVDILNGVNWAAPLGNTVYSFNENVVKEYNASKKKGELRDFPKDRYIRVLLNRYRNGMVFDSIDLEIFRDTYKDLFDEDILFDDADLIKRLKFCGVIYDERVFPAEGIIDQATNERLFAYIESKFATGNKVLYYKAIFTDLADVFEYCFSLRDENMLKAYIEYTAEEGKYYFHDDFMSTEENVKIDHSAEIIEYMLTAGKPLSYDEVYAGLSHISQDIIYREIHGNPMFVLNEKEHYFHIDIFEFSQFESDRISEIISKEIENDGYAIWSRIYGTVVEQLPIFLENNLYLSSLGLRNALSQKMGSLYNFEGEVISSKDAALGMGDVYRLYAMHHAPFSDTDVYNFSKEIGTNIYLWHLGEGATRVSKTLFVARDQIHFDVEAVDKALETYLTSGYILIKDVDSFLVFPNVGYEWNEFLLESFLIYHSKKFVLVNNGTSLNNVAGAIAPNGGAYTEFVDICAHVLAESGIELKKSVALNYLAEINLITRRSYKDIDVAMTKARQIRNRKG